MGTPLLTKDALNIGGHKLPIPIVLVVIGVATLIVMMRARARGGNVASVGQQPASNPSAYGNPSDAQLANIEQQVALLGQQLAQAPAGTPAPAAAAGPPQLVAGNPGSGQIPLYGPAPANTIPWTVGNLPSGTPVTLTGPPVVEPLGSTHYAFAPLNYLGGTYWVSISDLVTRPAPAGAA